MLYIHSCSRAGASVMHWELTKSASGDAHVQAVTQVALRDEPWHTWTLTLGWPVQVLSLLALLVQAYKY